MGIAEDTIVREVTFAAELMMQRDRAELALRDAISVGKANEVSTCLAEVDAAYQAAWDALDRARAAVAASGRDATPFDTVRNSLEASGRRLGVITANINDAGVHALRHALPMIQAAAPELDWAAAARAAATPAIHVGNQLRWGWLIAAGAIAGVVLALWLVIEAGRDQRAAAEARRAAAEAALTDADLEAATQFGDRTLRDFLDRHPEARDEVLARIGQRLRDQLPTLNQWEQADRIVDRATDLGLSADVRVAAIARLDALLADAVVGAEGDALAGLGDDVAAREARSLALPAARAAIATRVDVAIAANDLDTVLSLRSFVDPARYASVVAPMVNVRIAAARTPEEVADLVDVADESSLGDELGARAEQLAAAERRFEPLIEWFDSELLADAAADQVLARLVATASTGKIATMRAFLDAEPLADLDEAEAVQARLADACKRDVPRAGKSAKPAIAKLAVDACTSDDGMLTYGSSGDADNLAQDGADLVAKKIDEVLRKAGDDRESELGADADNPAADLDVRAPEVEPADDGSYPCHIVLVHRATGTRSKIDGRCGGYEP